MNKVRVQNGASVLALGKRRNIYRSDVHYLIVSHSTPSSTVPSTLLGYANSTADCTVQWYPACSGFGERARR